MYLYLFVGINVMVGPSLIGDGRGLFLNIIEESVDEVLLPRGTPVCGYNKGVFKDEAIGDKAVAYLFTSPYNGVIFQKKLMPLLDAVTIAQDLIKENNDDNNNNKITDKDSSANNMNISSSSSSSSPTLPSTTSSLSLSSVTPPIPFTFTNIKDIILGHYLELDPNNPEEIILLPNENYKQRYFCPYEININGENTGVEGAVNFGPSNFGTMCNDMAFYPNIEEEEYKNTSNEMNVLQIVWRLELDLKKKQLIPTWPVVICLCDVILRNYQPMEVGLEYGWKYWKSAMEKIDKSNSNE